KHGNMNVPPAYRQLGRGRGRPGSLSSTTESFHTFYSQSEAEGPRAQMLKFVVFENGQAAKSFVLRNAHLLGADGIGVRGAISFDGQQIMCEKRAGGP